MMYGYGTDGNVEPSRCKRDLEGDAQRLKKRIDTLSFMRDATENFVKSGYLHWLDEKEHRTALLVVIAGLGMEIPQLQLEYDRVLAEIEKEK